MFKRWTSRKEWKFFAVLPKAGPGLAVAWWSVLLLRGILPAAFAIAMGVLVAAVQHGHALATPLALAGSIFVLLQVLNPIHQALGSNLGDRTAAWLYDRLTEACVCDRQGIGHLEDATLTSDLTVARDFDLGMTGPPLSISMDFIASGLVEMVGGIASALILARYSWWAPLLLAGAWMATHWLLRESAIWRDRNNQEVRAAQRDADYAYRLAVDPPAAKELRLFGLSGWTIDRFIARRIRLHEIQYAATRLRERPVIWSLLLVVIANVVVFWVLAHSVATGRISLGEAVVYVQSAIGVSMIAFGGFSWALDGAAAPVAAVATPGAGHASCRCVGFRNAQGGRDARQRDPSARPSPSVIRERRRCLSTSISPSLPARRWPSWVRTAPVKPPWRSCCAVCTIPSPGPSPSMESICGSSISRRGVSGSRPCSRISFAWSYLYAITCRRKARPTRCCSARSMSAGADKLASLDTILARGYAGGTDLSGGQWQRVALARALAAVSMGSGVVLLDEPTAQLDVRGEAEIFDRLLAATRHCTTILISHRFSTVRQADRICVLEQGRVVELGSHDELMELGGRYRTMFDLQAQRFHDPEGVTYDTLF